MLFAIFHKIVHFNEGTAVNYHKLFKIIFEHRTLKSKLFLELFAKSMPYKLGVGCLSLKITKGGEGIFRDSLAITEGRNHMSVFRLVSGILTPQVWFL